MNNSDTSINAKMGVLRKLIPGIALSLSLCLGMLYMPSCSSPDNAGQSQPNTAESAGVTDSTDPSDSTEPVETSFTFTDDLGNEVSVEQPERVVACMGSFADIWQLSGGTLVGVTDDALDIYIDDSEGLTLVGDFTAPNLEQIIALEPDFVIMTAASTGRDGAASQTELRESLEASGITTAFFNVTTFDDYLRMLSICCEINGREDLYEEYGTAVESEINNIVAQAETHNENAPTVLLMTTYSGGTRVQDSSTMSGTMLADLGAINLADENTSLLREFSLESIIELNPDYIFVVPMGNDDEASLRNLQEATEANPAWGTLNAVKNENYQILDKELFLYKPNENWAKSYQVLYDELYA